MYRRVGDAYTVSPLVISASESTGSRLLSRSNVSTVIMSTPENTFGCRVARQATRAWRLRTWVRRLTNVPAGSQALAWRRLTLAAAAPGCAVCGGASAIARGVVASATRTVD